MLLAVWLSEVVPGQGDTDTGLLGAASGCCGGLLCHLGGSGQGDTDTGLFGAVSGCCGGLLCHLGGPQTHATGVATQERDTGLFGPVSVSCWWTADTRHRCCDTGT